MRNYIYATALVLSCALSACSSTLPYPNLPPSYPGNRPYWTNAGWQAAMHTAIQCVVHLPANMDTASTSGMQATVRFLYAHGVIKNPMIVKSTGNPDVDKLLLQQVITAKIPKPFGLHTDQSHEFELPLDMFTPYESFEYNVYAAIDRKQVYPRDPIIYGITGSTTVDFDYLNAKASHIVIVKSSGNKELDQSSVSAIYNAELPLPTPGYTSKTIPMQVIVCYCLNSAESCPTGKNVVVVEGTRIARRTVLTY